MSQEDFDIINRETRKDKIINTLKKNKKLISIIIIFIILIFLSIFSFDYYKSNKKTKISDKFNSAKINYKIGNEINTVKEMREIILKEDKTYSPLALYFLIDRNLVNSKIEINDYFDIVINNLKLSKSNKYLNIYKKALYNADTASEQELLVMLGPLIKENNEWKQHALYLMAEYYYENKEFEKSKEFFSSILSLEDINPNIKLESQIRLQRDLSD